MDSNAGSSVARRRRRLLTISDLLMLRHTLLSSSPKMINFLPLGKIYPVRFWWECGS
ncbi:unnamed protein product [Brassica oleracea var. botrytis]|uniref:(rape) hypothetical protein n=1 Tax=Brassica napus TaxID=3708 RepID=A0A816K1Q7_BRANA|nr:unnamed protein product [Brassica napus]